MESKQALVVEQLERKFFERACTCMIQSEEGRKQHRPTAGSASTQRNMSQQRPITTRQSQVKDNDVHKFARSLCILHTIDPL